MSTNPISEELLAAVRPQDMSNLLRHAFLAGRGAAPNTKLSNEDLAAWVSYDPEGLPAYERIMAALDRDRRAADSRANQAVVMEEVHPLASWPDGLALGLHRVFWKSGGSSLCAVGMQSDGKRWLAPCNWVAPTLNAGAGEWAGIERTEVLFPYPEDTAALSRAEGQEPAKPDFWALHSRTGMHIGLWPDEASAKRVSAEYDPGCIITPLYRSAPSASPAQEPVAVKPLEWGKTSYGTPEAFSVVGTYRINGAANGGYTVVFGGLRGRAIPGPDGRTNFATMDGAFAAAQAHFDQAINSVVVKAPAGKRSADTRR